MLIRAIALSLALLFGVGAIVPLMTDSTEAGPKHRKHKKKKLKKYSKAWWKWYRKQQRKKRAIAARKRALRARQILLARNKSNKPKVQTKEVALDKKGETREKVAAIKDDSAPAVLPSGKKAPRTFKQSQATNSDIQFRVNDDGGSQLGTAQLSVVGPAMGEDSDRGRNKTVGGVSTSSLRRNVIDKMVREEGWVVNDYQKTINGKKVYVVVAQSSVKGSIQSRLFYFTEVDGKIYSLATNSPSDSQEKIAQESEKVIQSLQRGNRPTQAGLK